jgi:MmyB-like transcription regulator ligand binding domain
MSPVGTAADTCVAILCTEARRDRPPRPPHARPHRELATRGDEFRHRWFTHDVRLQGAGTKNFHHTAVGNLELAYESVDTLSEPDFALAIYAAESASRTAEAPTTRLPDRTPTHAKRRDEIVGPPLASVRSF